MNQSYNVVLGIAVLVSAAALAAGCGGDDGTSEANPSPQQSAEIVTSASIAAAAETPEAILGYWTQEREASARPRETGIEGPAPELKGGIQAGSYDVPGGATGEEGSTPGSGSAR